MRETELLAIVAAILKAQYGVHDYKGVPTDDLFIAQACLLISRAEYWLNEHPKCKASEEEESVDA